MSSDEVFVAVTNFPKGQFPGSSKYNELITDFSKNGGVEVFQTLEGAYNYIREINGCFVNLEQSLSSIRKKVSRMLKKDFPECYKDRLENSSKVDFLRWLDFKDRTLRNMGINLKSSLKHNNFRLLCINKMLKFEEDEEHIHQLVCQNNEEFSLSIYDVDFEIFASFKILKKIVN